MGWRVAGIVAGTIVVLTLALVGYIWWQVTRPLDAGLVASHVKTFEGDDVDVDVKACEKTVGEAITNDDYGPSLQEVWRCDVNRRDDRSGFAESCYVVYSGLVSGIVRNIRCAAVGPSCPAGGSGDRKSNGRFLGRMVDPTLVLEEELGNSQPYTTIRAVVHYQAGGARERCGYLNVRVPVGDEPLPRATELVEGSGFSAPRYSVSYSLVGG
jgi:hypothetical protein